MLLFITVRFVGFVVHDRRQGCRSDIGRCLGNTFRKVHGKEHTHTHVAPCKKLR